MAADVAEPTAIPDGVLIGASEMLERIGGNAELLPRMVAVAIESIVNVPAQLRSAAAEGDREAMDFQAHYAKGTAGYLQLPWLHALALGAEQAVRDGTDDAPQRLETLAVALERLVADLRRLLPDRP